MSDRQHYVVVRASLDGYGRIEAPEIATFADRHYFRFPAISYRAGAISCDQIASQMPRGAILVLEHGVPGRRQLRMLSQLLSRGMRAFVAWPHENAIEAIDRERLSSFRRHWIATWLAYRVEAWLLRRAARRLSLAVPSQSGSLSLGSKSDCNPLLRELNAETPSNSSGSSARTGPYTVADLPSVAAFLHSAAENARPVPLPIGTIANREYPFDGTGVYLRLDFWAAVTSGGSYGHTCYQAQALSETTQDFVCVTANRFAMLDDLGVRQVTVRPRDVAQTETNILGMNAHYAERLGPLFDALRPAFIFERMVLGSAVGAWASRRFNIPYIVEYNGSEIAMKKSFSNGNYTHEGLLVLAEEAAFRQATLISVISEHVANDVAGRGIARSRILVNPNAVDLEAYSPAPSEERTRLRAQLGFAPHHRVVGFIGTFGGWHGIEVLAAALPAIVRGDDSVRVLLIGDGSLKHLVAEAVARAKINDRVVDMGKVPQARGAQLLKACDVLVSPHARNMIDGPFFGSPTKLFEYMAMAAGIVASDLGQISDILSPSLRTADIVAAQRSGRSIKISNQRALLCTPGDVDDFVAGVLALVRDPLVAEALGRNARAAAEKHYTWRQHVDNLWLTLAGRPAKGYAIDRHKE